MNVSMKAGLLAALPTALALISPALAEDFQAGDLTIQHPWARATPNGAPVAGGYVTIVNHGKESDSLTGGSFAVARATTLHTMSMENGVMKMREAGGLPIPPGGSVTLSPSGTHLMFTGLNHGLKKGETIDGTLIFAHAGTVAVRFGVEAIGAKAPSDGHAAMPGMTMD